MKIYSDEQKLIKCVTNSPALEEILKENFQEKSVII